MCCAGNKLQSFVHEVRTLAGGESDEAALQKLREMPALEEQRRQLLEFERRVRSLVSRRPSFTHIAARGTDGWFESDGTAGPAGSIDGLKSTLYNLTEMLHFEISAVELRATMHKVDALVKEPDGVMQATLNKVEALLDVSAIDAVLPTMQQWRVSQIESDAARNKLSELLRLPAAATWPESESTALSCWPASRYLLSTGVVSTVENALSVMVTA